LQLNIVGLLSQSDRYVSPYSLESLTGDRAPVFHHQQHLPSQSVCFRSAVDYYRYDQPPSPTRPPASAAFCFRQFIARPPFRALPQQQHQAAASSSNPALSPPSSASSSTTILSAGPLDYSPKASAAGSGGSEQSIGRTSSGGGGGSGGVSSTSGGGQRRSSAFQDGVTVGYTYDAFFVSDGRSRRRGSHARTSSLSPSARHPQPSTPTPPAAVRQQGQARQRYTCAECGKHYATSSNLSRHKQTHRSLDSQQARHCPHCSKVTQTTFFSVFL